MPPDRTSPENNVYHLKTTTMDGKICKPSRKAFERQCKQLADEIHVIHTKLADNKAHLNELFLRLNKLREERNAKFVEKSLVEGTVKEMSVNINKLTERLSQLQSKLHYRDMKKLEDAIRTLQNHLDSRHFKHSEEKKIVAEIDKLNRSKKVVGEYLDTQTELKDLRTSQHSKRVDRDKLIKDIVVIRKQEEDARSKLTAPKALESQLKTDLEELIEHKTTLKQDFTKHQQTFAEQKSAQKQAEMECRQKQQQQSVCRAVSTRCLSNAKQEADVIPQTQEMVNCQKLIEFCERLTKCFGDAKAAQRHKKKRISYTTDILAQFVSIDICPPMTVAHASTCIPILQQKLTDLRQLQKVHSSLSIVDEGVEHETMTENTLSVEVNSADDEMTAGSVSDEHITDDIVSHIEDMSENGTEIEAEHPDDQSDKSSMTKQLSSTSDEEMIESITYKLELLDSLCHLGDQMIVDSSIA